MDKCPKCGRPEGYFSPAIEAMCYLACLNEACEASPLHPDKRKS